MAKTLIIALVLATAFSAHALDSKSEFKMTAARWRQDQSALLPIALCEDRSYFRTCFGSSKGTCVDSARIATRACAEAVRMPSSINPYREGRRFALDLGLCVGRRIEKTWASRKSAEHRCQRPDGWVE